MAAQFVKHKLAFTIGAAANHFYFLAPDGQYDGIGTETGITKVTDGDEKLMPACNVEQLLKSPAAFRRVIRHGAAGGKQKNSKIIVAADKVDTVAAAIVGKTYKGGSVSGVHEPLSASFS